jgi:hypothetical protein
VLMDKRYEQEINDLISLIDVMLDNSLWSPPTMMIYILFILGRFFRNNLVRWWTNWQNSLPIPSSLLVYVDDTIWSEMSNNWYEDPYVYVWHAASTNEWEAATLPPGWGDFTPPPTTALTPWQWRQAKYHQIENLKL